MALFPNKPIKTIPLTPFMAAGGTEVPNCAYGPWKYNGVRWGAGNYSVGLGAFGSRPYPLSVIKSSDAGVTWTRVDQTNYPVALDANVGADVVFDEANGVLHFLSKTASANYCKFDMNGGGGVGAWGTSTSLAVNSVDSKMGLRLNGDLLAVLNGGVNNGPLQYSVISGGTFGAAATLVAAGGAGVAFYPVGLLVGTDGVAHVFYQRAAASSTQLWYVTIDASNTIGTPALAAVVPFASGTNGIPLQIGQGAIWNDRLEWAFIKSSGSGVNEVTLYEGTPVSAPVWTVKLVTTLPFTNTSSSLQVFVVPAGITQLQLFWVSNNAGSPKQLQYASYDGTTFGTPLVAWDAVANPCTGDPGGSDDLASFSVGTVDGDFEVLADEYCDSSFHTTLVWLGPPLLVECNNPPAGTVGTAYTHTFTGLNGVPPRVFTISAGALPDGLSMSSSGVVTGTPTVANAFNFTVLVTDADSNTDSTDCSITIAPGAPVINTTSLPTVTVDVETSITLSGTGTVWSVINGSLPPGLTLDSSTGVISGTPTLPGTYTFQVQLSGNGTPDIAPFTLVVVPLPDSAPGVPPGPGDSGGGIPDAVAPVVVANLPGSPWVPGNCWDISTPCARTGAYGLRRIAPCISGDSSTTSTQQIAVSPGQEYYLEFFVKTGNSADGILSFGFNFYDAAGVFISFLGVDSSGSPSDWTMFSGTITVPLLAVTASPVIKSTNHTTGSFCVNGLFSGLLDENFQLISIRHLSSTYTDYR